eukprot:628937_1
MGTYLLSLFVINSIVSINGESIKIMNPGFEEDDPSLVPNSNSNPNELIGWTLYDPYGVNRQYDSPGVSCPGSCWGCTSDQGVSFDDPIYGDSAPEGKACLYLWADWNEGAFGVEQELLSTFEPVTSYILSAKIGNQGYNVWTHWNGDYENWGDDCNGWSGYVMQLVAENTIVAQDDNSIYIPDQHWQTITVHYTTSSSDSAIGKQLKIRLLQKNDDAATGHCLMFDDVVLTANTDAPTPSPTPSHTPSSTASPTPPPTASPTALPSDTLTFHPISAFPTRMPALYPCDITSDCWWPPTLSPSQTIQTTTSTSMKVIEASSDADITSDAGTFMSAPIAYYIVGGVLWAILLAMCCCLLYAMNKRHAQENVMDLSCQDTIADVEVQKIQRELCHSPKYVTVSPTTSTLHSLPGFFKRMSHATVAADESDDEKQP